MLRSRLYWKVLTNFGILIAIITAMAVLTGAHLRSIESDFQSAADDTRFLSDIERVQYDLSELSVLADDYARFGELSVRIQYERRLRESIFRLSTLAETASDSATAILLDRAQRHLRTWAAGSGSRRIAAGDLLAGNGAVNGEESTNAAYSDLHLDNARNALRQIFREKIASHQGSIDKAAHISRNIPTYIYIVNILIVFFAIVLGLVLTRSIVKPIRRLRESTERLTDGTFEPLAMDRKDEFGDLAENFNKMSVLIYSQYKNLKVYSELVTNLNASKNIKHVAVQSLSHMCTHTGAYAGVIYLLNRRTNCLERMSGIGLDPMAPVQHSVPIGEGIIGRCAAVRDRVEQKMSESTDVAIPGFPVAEDGFILAVPLELRNALTGVIVLAAYEPFDTNRYSVINQSLPQIAVSIAIAQHHEETENLSIEISQKNKELNQKNAELEHVHRDRSEYLAHISHELRTPLNAVIGYSTALLHTGADTLSTDQHKAIDSIRTNGELLLRIIENMLDYSKLELQRMPVSLGTATVASVVDQSVRATEPLLTEKQLILKTEVHKNLPRLETDTLKIVQILINLIHNAIKFSDEGTIILSAGLEDDMLRFDVEDSGIGIAPEDREAIFEEFKQIETDNRRACRGSGLGLPIARGLARLLGGDIAVQSVPGKGSVFTVLLPPVYTSADASNEGPQYDITVHPSDADDMSAQ
jgi:signal transduction histidine kinase/HAMP domain-containing protein